MGKKIFAILFSIFAFTLTSCEVSKKPDPSKEQFSVSFDANGGEVSGEPIVTVDAGTLFKDIQKPTFSKTGFYFSYFSLDEDGSRVIMQNYPIVRDIVVFAQYSVTSIKLTFDSNGGELIGNSQISVDYGTEFQSVNAPIAVKEYSEFSYWSFDKEGKETITNDFRFIKDEMLFAQYVDLTCYITFDPKGGKLSGENSIAVSKGTKFADVENVPNASYDSMIFVGWFLDEELKNPITKDYVFANDITLYAKYADSTIIITFDANAGTLIGNKTLTIAKGTAFGQIDNEKIPSCTKNNYIFDGWSLNSSGPTIANNYVFNNDLTLYAIYSLDEVTLTFDSNGGDTETSSIKILRNISFKNVTLPAMSKTGYHLTKWTFDKDGLNPISDDYEIKDNLTIYAQYEIDIIKIIFETNGGSLESSSEGYIYVDYGTEVKKISLPNCIKDDYTFLYWSLSNTEVTPISNDYVFTQDTTLYAIYEIKTVELIFNFNNGSSSQVYNVKIKSKWSEIEKPTNPSKDGYTFKGWSQSESAYTPYDENFVFIEDKVIFAYYTINRYSVTFDANGGTLSFNTPVEVDWGTKFGNINKPTATYISSDKSFYGWSYSSDGEKISDDELIKSDVVIYAIYKNLPKFTVYFDSVDGEIASGLSQIDVLEGTLWKNVSKPTVTKENYIFSYWSFDVDGLQAVNDDYTITKLTIVYAQYELKQLIITFDPNGGEITSGSNTANVPYGNKWSTVAKPTVVHPLGYALIGWSITKSKDVGMLTDDSIVDLERTVYAIYDDKVTITFDANGGSIFGGETVDIVIGNPFSSIFLTRPLASKSGYRFQYWSYDKEGNNKVEDNDTFTEDTTIYAIYIQQFTVSFDPGEGTFNDTASHQFTVDKGTILNAIKGYKEPSCDNAEFIGWSTSSSRDDIISNTTIVESNLSLTAIYQSLDTLCIVDSGDNIINAYQSIAIEYENKSTNDVTATLDIGLSSYFDVEVDEERNVVYVDNISGPFSGAASVTLSNGSDSKTITFNVKKPSNRLELSEAVDFALMRQDSSGYSYIDIELDGYSVEDTYPDFWNSSIEGRSGVSGYNADGWKVGSNHISVTTLANDEMATKSVDISQETRSQYYYENMINANFERRYQNKTSRIEDEFYIDKVNKRMIVHNSENLFVAMERGYRPEFVDSEIGVSNSVANRAYQVYQKAREWCLDAFGDELTTDFEKERQLFEYIVNKTHYDHWIVSDDFKEEYPTEFSLNWSSYAPEGVFLNNGISVCDGMAKALTIMSRIEGLEVVRQAGFSSTSGHGWNLFKYNDEWYLICPTNAHQSVNGLSEILGYQVSFMYYPFFMNSGHFYDDDYYDQRFFTNLNLSESQLDIFSMDYFTSEKSFSLDSYKMASQLGASLPELSGCAVLSYNSTGDYTSYIFDAYNSTHSFKFTNVCGITPQGDSNMYINFLIK